MKPIRGRPGSVAVENVVRTLRSMGYATRSETPADSAKIDIVADAPDGRTTLVVEVKAGGEGESLPIGAIAQVKAYAEALSKPGHLVLPLLLTDLDVSTAAKDAAKALRVDILRASSKPGSANEAFDDALRHYNPPAQGGLS